VNRRERRARQRNQATWDEDGVLHIDAKRLLEEAGRCSCEDCQQQLIEAARAAVVPGTPVEVRYRPSGIHPPIP